MEVETAASVVTAQYKKVVFVNKVDKVGGFFINFTPNINRVAFKKPV